jgi:hypothetical protein
MTACGRCCDYVSRALWDTIRKREMYLQSRTHGPELYWPRVNFRPYRRRLSGGGSGLSLPTGALTEIV